MWLFYFIRHVYTSTYRKQSDWPNVCCDHVNITKIKKKKKKTQKCKTNRIVFSFFFFSDENTRNSAATYVLNVSQFEWYFCGIGRAPWTPNNSLIHFCLRTNDRKQIEARARASVHVIIMHTKFQEATDWSYRYKKTKHYRISGVPTISFSSNCQNWTFGQKLSRRIHRYWLTFTDTFIYIATQSLCIFFFSYNQR